MILLRILKKDLLRKKGAMLVVSAFIALSALLVSAGSRLIVELNGSLDALFREAQAPHLVQMHSGEIDRDELEAWAATESLVEALQVVEMITLDGSALFLGEAGRAEENSIMDISFVSQNGAFDFLLDLENRVVDLAPGQIGIPAYYAAERDLGIGDTVRVGAPMFTREFLVAAVLRDAQMNPSIVHSKRFLVHRTDYLEMREQFHEVEYLIELRLSDADRVGEVTASYLAAGLPKRGPTVDHRLFRTLNALTDGIVAAVVIVLSLLLITIAILCLRFTLLATMEEDYREIGVMKAIGMARRDIRRIYLTKYVALGALASLLGSLASLPLGRVLAANMTLYIGHAPKTLVQQAVSPAAALGIFLVVLLSCALILRRFAGISAVEALRSGSARESPGHGKFLPLRMSRGLDVRVFLGIRDVVQRFRLFGLLGFIFFFCSFIVIIPTHLLTTMRSPGFVSYMGIGRSDLRIDLRPCEAIEERFESMITHVAKDGDVARLSPLVTSRFALVNQDGEHETIAVETGDFALFPLDYLHGGAPQSEDEIALSFLSAKDLGKRTGDSLLLVVDGGEREMRVSGIYQDVTNGGRTAKAALPHNRANVLWYTLSLDLKPGASIAGKVQEYSAAFRPARVTDLESYIAQTLGNTIDQLARVTIVAIVVGLFVSVLITLLFLRMLVQKDRSRIAIMKSLGFSLLSIRLQYLTTALSLLCVGMAAGTVFSNTVGQAMVSALWSLMGASQIRFVIDGLQAYVLLPLLLLTAVAATTVISISGIRETSITAAIAE